MKKARPYEGFSAVYDSYMDEYDCDAWFRYLHELSGIQNLSGKRILDLGCGTGDMLRRFAEAGAVCTGVDISSDMLKVATSKFDGEHFRAVLIDGDISKTVITSRFDFIYCIGDTINYLEKNGLDSLFSNVCGMLADGGSFTFDMLNKKFMLENRAKETVITASGDIVFNRRINGDTLTTEVLFENNGVKFKEVHTQRFYSTAYAVGALQRAAFQYASCYGIFTRTAWSENSEKIQVIARK